MSIKQSKLNVGYEILLVLVLSLGQAVAQDSPAATQYAAARPEAAQPAADPNVKPVDPANFMIGNDDVLAINVWKEPELSRSVPVRSDGKISLPLVGEVQATGETPRQLETEIAKQLKSYIAEPEVTVMVQQINSQKFNILGQVVRPGSYALTNSIRVLDAIAVAGGFRDFAKKKSIYVLRAAPDGSQAHLAFNYKDVIKGKSAEQNVKLEPRDTIVVP